MPVQRTAPDPDAIKKAVEMLLAAKNPILWAGQGVHYAEAGDKLAALAELLPAPVVATNPGKSAIPDSHPLALGGATRSRSKVFADFMKKADVVMAIGSSLTITNFGPAVPAGKTIIHSTNDAGDINKEYRADLAVVGDAGLVIDALIAEVAKQKGPGGGNALDSLKEEVAAGKKAWLDEWAKFLNSDEMPLNQYRVIRDMMRTLDRDNVIMTHDSGSPREQMIPFWETTVAGSYMGWGKSTQLGYGLGITMGAKLAAPKKHCINVMGDASFGMTGMDIETAARNRIAILTIVFNNGVMGAERDVLKISDEKYGAMTVGGNYKKVAEGLNVAATRVEKPGDIVGAIKDAVGVTEKARRSCSNSWSRKATIFRATPETRKRKHEDHHGGHQDLQSRGAGQAARNLFAYCAGADAAGRLHRRPGAERCIRQDRRQGRHRGAKRTSLRQYPHRAARGRRRMEQCRAVHQLFDPRRGCGCVPRLAQRGNFQKCFPAARRRTRC